MSQRTRDEWMLYPEAEDVTLRCKWENIHKASGLSDRELSHTTLFGRGRKLPAIDKRNGIKQASPGDKSYQAAEYSPGFHRGGSTRPVVNFGGNMIVKPDTFVPLQEMPSIARESFYAKEKQRQLEEEAQEVHSLERWRPATPLIPPDGPSVIIEHGTSVHL